MAFVLLAAAALLPHGALAEPAIFPVNDVIYVNKIIQVAAVATTDIGYRACTAASAYLDYCYTLLGGEDITLAPQASVRKCACCLSGTPVSPAYSTCATYIRTEVPELTSEFTLWSDLYTICRTEATLCLSTPTIRTSTTTTPRTTITGPQTYARDCTTMVDIVTSCINRGGEFSRLPATSQAECYCYTTDSDTTSWIPDYLDGAASRCASWARTGEPETAYQVALTFMSFCHAVGDVLATKAVTRTSPTAVTTSNATPSSTRVTTVTITPTPTNTAVVPASPASAIGKTPSMLILTGFLGVVVAVFALF